MISDYSDVIFENYDLFLKENNNQMATPSGAVEMLSSDGSFRAYMEALTDGLAPVSKAVVLAVAQREREMLLEESVNFGPSGAAIGYNVTYFPILADIYSDPVISQLATTYPVGKSMITIPKVKVRGTVTNAGGGTSTWVLPRDTHLVRAAAKTLNLSPGSTNLYTASSLTAEDVNVNRRYFIITSVQVHDTATSHNFVVPISVRADARGQLASKFTFIDTVNGNAQTEGSLIGNIDFSTGVVQYSITYASPVNGITFVTDSIGSSIVFSPRKSDIGRVKVSLDIQGWDVNIDVKDDFEVELQTETIDDYRDIYNVDLIRTLSLAIKQQILLNKDWDLQYYLAAYESEMVANGASAAFDLDTFMASGSIMQPNNVMDIFKSAIPYINSVSRTIRKNFRADPQYILCGLKTASMLESLQSFVVNFPDQRQGELGYQANTPHYGIQGPISFRKQTILASGAVTEGKIYVIYKAPSDDLTRATIIDLVYKPLYLIDEVTNSLKRTFVKSRTALEITNTEALGVITLSNYAKYLG